MLFFIITLESHLYRDGLHSNGTTMLAGNFILRIRSLWCDVDSNREKLPNGNNITLTANVEPSIDLSVINPDNYSKASVESVLKFYRSEFPKNLIISHININSIRNKFEISKSMLSEVLDVLMITERLNQMIPLRSNNFILKALIYRLDLIVIDMAEDYCYILAIMLMLFP